MNAPIMMILFTAACFLMAFCANRDSQHSDDDEERDMPQHYISREQLDRHIEKLHQLKQQRKEIDDLITNLELCSPRERVGMVQFHWMDIDGSHHELDMFTDGTENTKRLIAVAKAEREDITASLLRELEAAYYGDNVTETMREYRFGNVTETLKEEIEADD